VPIDIQPVHPGDLITAARFNEIIDALKELDERIGQTPGPAAGPRIDRFDPSEVEMSGTLRILGANFAVPDFQNRVTIGGRRPTRFMAGSTDRELRVVVPSGFTGLPRELPVVVETADGRAERGIRVVTDEPVPLGPLAIRLAPNEGRQVRVRRRVRYTFALDAEQVNMEETYRLEAVFTNPVFEGDALRGTVQEWLTSVEFSPRDRVTVDPSASEPVEVEVSFVVPAGAVSVLFSLRAVSLRNPGGAGGESGPVVVEVGEDQEQGDASIRVVLGDLLGQAQLTTENGRTFLELPFGEPSPVQTPVSVDHAGEYRPRIRVVDAPDSQWEVSNESWTGGALTDNGGEVLSFDLELRGAARDAPRDVGLLLEVRVEGTRSDNGETIHNFLRQRVRALGA
jgi:hypothetical protein